MLAFVAMLLSSVLFLLFIKLFQDVRNRPRLELTLGNLVWQYRAEDDLTVIFILASLINKGAPSVTLNWEINYKVAGTTEKAEIYQIYDSYVLNVDKTRLSLTNENLVNLKTLETPIQRGQFVGGRLFFALPGDRTEQIKSIQHTIEVQCRDYLGNAANAVYRPSSNPPKTLLGHYKEKREPIKQVDSSSRADTDPSDIPSLSKSSTPSME